MDWLTYEKETYAQGYRAVCGVDEAGRGPLAGPVCAAAVLFPEGTLIDGVNDSKKLSEKKREALFDEICGRAVSYCVAWASVDEIESINILNAAMLAMKRAVEGLHIPADFARIEAAAIELESASPFTTARAGTLTGGVLLPRPLFSQRSAVTG